MNLHWFHLWIVFVLWCWFPPMDADRRPHIIFILADDMGWNDVSYHGSDQIPTPNIDSLAYNGVIMNRHYVQPLCTPSRASLMTGKYPIHTGLHWALSSAHKNGLPLSEKLMPKYFKELGYTTRLIGKWHLGFYKKQYTPLERGFDSHFGYWSGAVSYYDHIYEILDLKIRYKAYFNGHDMKRNYTPAWDVLGQYATDVFTEEAIREIENHPPDKPMFLLLSHLAVHAGNQGKWLEAPQEEINKFSYICNPNRRTYAAMVSKLDQSVGKVMEALGRKYMLKNSIIVFASDNGAPHHGNYNNWGSNYPFRGQKGTLWEGGIRVPAVVWSPLIKKPSRVSNNLMHMTDWLPTLLSAAGYNTQTLDIDGMNQWNTISKNLPGPRERLIIDIYNEGQMNGLIFGPFKYIKGATRYPRSPEMNTFVNTAAIFSKKEPKYDIKKVSSSKTWIEIQKLKQYGKPYPDIARLRQDATITCNGNFNSSLNCDDNPCLFNLFTDVCEQKNIALNFPLLRIYMEALLSKSKIGMHPGVQYFTDPKSNPENFNGTWSIWIT